MSVAVDGLHYYVTTADTVFRTTTARIGSPTMIASAQEGPRSIKTLHRGATTEVYWANQTSGQIMRVVIAADQSVGSPIEIVKGAPGVFDLDVSLGSVFWSNTSTGEIWRLALDGGTTLSHVHSC